VNRVQLRLALREAGVADGLYRIEGVHEPWPPAVDFLFLRRSGDGGWETGTHERGAGVVGGRFATEEEACAHLRELLLPPG
jgi:hypothetical protein